MIAPLPSITMTPNDHQRLIRTAQELAAQAHPLAAPLLHELHRAALCAPDELPDDVVTLDTFVTYRLADEDRPEKRMLIHPDDSMWPPAELSILTPVGLSLLGQRAGDQMPLLGTGSADAYVEVEAVGPRVTGAFVQIGTPRSDSPSGSARRASDLPNGALFAGNPVPRR